MVDLFGEEICEEEETVSKAKRFFDYDTFVDKFKPKLTTDDCYTPPAVYEAVKKWVCERYGIDAADIVRPFFPGGDYERFEYPENCVVLDNPPFSILARIKKFYVSRKIRFFLFAPHLTLFSGRGNKTSVCCIVAKVDIEYENGAVVPTDFVTNLERGTAILVSGTLHNLLDIVKTEKKKKPKLPKYSYPPEVVTSALLEKIAVRGIDMSFPSDEVEFVSQLDSQRLYKKALFGGGFFISARLAAERLAAERLAAEEKEIRKWELSARERDIIARLAPKCAVENKEA